MKTDATAGYQYVNSYYPAAYEIHAAIQKKMSATGSKSAIFHANSFKMSPVMRRAIETRYKIVDKPNGYLEFTEIPHS